MTTTIDEMIRQHVPTLAARLRGPEIAALAAGVPEPDKGKGKRKKGGK